MSVRFRIDSWPRRVLGSLLALGAIATLLSAQTVDWGVAWMLIIPALVVLVPALGLIQSRRLQLEGDQLSICTGWLWRRVCVVPLSAGATLEILPTAGLCAVLLHQGRSEIPLGTWLTRARAEALAAWCDQAAPKGAWPRRQRSAHRLDR